MARWKDQFLDAAQLKASGLPYHPSLLDESEKISVFDYIQYHLGYLLSVTSFELGAGHVRFTIQNNGFAAPLNFNALSLVVGGEEYLVDSYSKYALGSMRAATYTVDLPEGFDSSQRIGLKLAHCAGSPISARFVNDTEVSDGVQWMTEQTPS
jgi:hypothetical protein